MGGKCGAAVAAVHNPVAGAGERNGRVSHLTGTFLWPWQPLSSLQQLCEPQYCHLPLGEAYELDKFLEKTQDKLFKRQRYLGGSQELEVGLQGF